MTILNDTLGAGVLRIRDLRISLERAVDMKLISNLTTAKYAVNKLNILGAILSSVSKVQGADCIISKSFSEEDKTLISSITDFACTVMLYEPEDTRLNNFITQVVKKAA